MTGYVITSDTFVSIVNETGIFFIMESFTFITSASIITFAVFAN